MLELNRTYLVSLTDETGFKGKFVNQYDEFFVFETFDTNSVINEGGSQYVRVPAKYYVNPKQIVVAKEIYSQEECSEYWTASDNTYDFERAPTRIFLREWQRDNFNCGKLYKTEQECKSAEK